MTVTAPANLEIGRYNTVTVADGLAVKLTRDPLPTYADAEALEQQLGEYHAALAAGPLAVASLLDVSVVSDADGYHVKHVMEYLDGPSISDLPEDERRRAASALASTVMGMPTYRDGRIKTPPDLKNRNLVVIGGVAVLFDICPPWVWGSDGYVRTALQPDMDIGTRAQTSAMVGYRSGVLSDVMLAVVPDIHPGESKDNHLRRALATAPNWYNELMPSGMPSASREVLDTLIEAKLQDRLWRTA